MSARRLCPAYPAAALLAFWLAGCASVDPSSIDGDPFGLEKMGDKPKTAAAVPEASAGGSAAPADNKPVAFVLKDGTGRIRVTGTLQGAHMEGLWTYFDPNGRKLATVTYLSDVRHGPVTLFYVTGDGSAAGKKKMTGVFADGTPHGTATSFWPNKKKKLEREFNRGLLENSEGWHENGSEMTDAEAQTASLEESRTEDALLSELEAFVLLHARQRLQGQ